MKALSKLLLIGLFALLSCEKENPQPLEDPTPVQPESRYLHWNVTGGTLNGYSFELFVNDESRSTFRQGALTVYVGDTVRMTVKHGYVWDNYQIRFIVEGVQVYARSQCTTSPCSGVYIVE
jgi:hypothetical protein